MTEHDDLRFLLGGYILGGLGPDDQLPRLLDAVRRERVARRRRTLVAGVDDSVSRGEAVLLEKAWGTAVTLDVDQLPDEGPFTLQGTSSDGTRQLAATWGTTPAAKAVVAGATSIPAEEITSVRVLGPDGPILAGSPGSPEA